MDHSQSTEQPQSSTQLGLLILVLSMFIAIWESDGKHHREVAQREFNRRSQLVATQDGKLSNKRSLLMVSQNKQPLWDVKLPVGIVPGEYQIVSNRGSVLNRWITFDDIRRQRMMPGREVRDLYFLDEADQRTYFIRVSGRTAVAQRGN